MGLTYFRRFRMDLDLRTELPVVPNLPPGYELIPFSEDVIREHATAKFHSFRNELDANVFPCLGRRDGCLRLMREISRRPTFIPQSTWLIRYRDRQGGRPQPIGTIQGMDIEGWGAIQNLGVEPAHRGRGLGTVLMAKSAHGFYEAGLRRMHLEVTTDNVSAVRLYERIGFRQAAVIYKAAEVAGT
ncbi:MAG: GNAT family N-acetyltransferase [Planctomycetota bacterium]